MNWLKLLGWELDLDTFKEEAFGPTGFNKSKGEFVQGLQNRRDAERALFDTPIR